MLRRPRVRLDGIPLHIEQRGHNREPCFFGEEDYDTYLHWLGEALKETNCSLHAYALMTHHVHLLLTPQESRDGTQACYFVGTALRAYIHRQDWRTGTLWDSRYKSSLIQAETYLLHALHRNEPVRAAMVDDPAHYRWTRYRADALGQFSPLPSPHPVYLALGAVDHARRVAYRSLFRPHLDPETIRDLRLALIP